MRSLQHFQTDEDVVLLSPSGNFYWSCLRLVSTVISHGQWDYDCALGDRKEFG
jgi:hypothetical protein